MPTYLNKELKEAIVKNALIKAGINKAQDKLTGLFNQLARDTRIFVLGGPEKAARLDALIESIHSNIKEIEQATGLSLHLSSGVSAFISPAYGGHRVGDLCYGYDDKGHYIRKLTPYQYDCLVPAEHELTKRANQLQKQKSSLSNKKNTIHIKVEAMLNSVKTVEKLLKVWPEASELIPKDAQQKVITNLPAVPIEDLNALIGLSNT